MLLFRYTNSKSNALIITSAKVYIFAEVNDHYKYLYNKKAEFIADSYHSP